MIECSCHIDFCCGHRILGHQGKCANLHGHNYELFLHAKGALNQLGMVVDFSLLKREMKNWIDKNWDHNTLIFEKDKTLMAIKDSLGQPKPPYVCSFNTTAENMALHLLNEVCPKLFESHGIEIHKVELAETSNNKVTVTR